MSLLFSRYPQTWGLVSRLKRLSPRAAAAAQWLCGAVIGHEVSKTEWGYGGGEFADVWCRWCNKVGRMPHTGLARFSGARSTIWGITGCDVSGRAIDFDNQGSA